MRRGVIVRWTMAVAIAAGAVLVPAQPARATEAFSDGFESGDLSAWTTSTGLTVQSVVVHTGGFAARTNSSVGWMSTTLASQYTELFAKVSVNVVSQADTFRMLKFQTASGSDIFGVFIVGDGRLRTRNFSTSVNSTSSTTIHPGWNDIQARALVSGTSSRVQVWLDGVEVSDLASSASLGSTPIGGIQVGNDISSRVHDAVYDDVVADTSFIGGGPPPTEPPPTPGNLRTTFVGFDRVDLAWDASSGAGGYTLYRDGTFLDTTTATTFSDMTVEAETTYQYAVDAFNSVGNSPPTEALPVTTTSAPPSGGAVVRAAGDIACDPADPAYNNGNGTSSKCRMKYTAQLLEGADQVLTLGDQQYDCGGLTAFNQSYDPTWGKYKAITHPILADEEYDTQGTGCGAAGADGYFSYFGAAAGPQPGGYYSFDFAGWHFIALSSECNDVPGGCGEGSPQNNWLEADLDASTAPCTIAMLHEPRFRSKKSGSQIGSAMLPFWEDLYAAGVEMVLGGDSHFYERFRPQTPQGAFDPNGVVQWVVGVGGKSHGGLASPSNRLPNSVTGTAQTFGVLELTLRDGAYDWDFLVEGSSSSFSDSGTASCH